MKKKDINSVAYLFKEMDPSEEVEFERDLEKNENLLIEVESLRQVQERLNDLPQVSAPDHVLNSICREAADLKKSSRTYGLRSFYYAAAAMVLVGFVAGALLLDQSSENSDASQAATGISSLSINSEASGAEGHGSDQTASATKISPWVDNNEVLRFGDSQPRTDAASMDSVLRDSYNRLTPVTNPTQSGYINRQLQLTGSRP